MLIVHILIPLRALAAMEVAAAAQPQRPIPKTALAWAALPLFNGSFPYFYSKIPSCLTLLCDTENLSLRSTGRIKVDQLMPVKTGSLDDEVYVSGSFFPKYYNLLIYCVQTLMDLLNNGEAGHHHKGKETKSGPPTIVASGVGSIPQSSGGGGGGKKGHYLAGFLNINVQRIADEHSLPNKLDPSFLPVHPFSENKPDVSQVTIYHQY